MKIYLVFSLIVTMTVYQLNRQRAHSKFRRYWQPLNKTTINAQLLGVLTCQSHENLAKAKTEQKYWYEDAKMKG
jgi:hypothetical protein